MGDLVQRLRGYRSRNEYGDPVHHSIVEEAADRIEALTAERDALRARVAELEAGQTAAARDVLAERRRQVEVEGWTHEHDDQHVKGEMAGAAACYALYRSHVDPVELMGEGVLEMSWPWDPEWWKPTTRRRDLVKAAALLLAEIERLDRAAQEPRT